MEQKGIFNSKFTNSHSFSNFYLLYHVKMKHWYFDLQLTKWDLNKNYCSFFMLKNTFVSRKGDVKNWWRFDEPVTLFFWDEKTCCFWWNEHDTYDYEKSTSNVAW